MVSVCALGGLLPDSQAESTQLLARQELHRQQSRLPGSWATALWAQAKGWGRGCVPLRDRCSVREQARRCGAFHCLSTHLGLHC